MGDVFGHWDVTRHKGETEMSWNYNAHSFQSTVVEGKGNFCGKKDDNKGIIHTYAQN